jgi:hypothetical protein
MRKFVSYFFIICSVLLSACTEKPKAIEPTQTPVQIKTTEQNREDFIREFSGVWASVNNTITINYDNNQMLVMYGDERLDLSLGDVDMTNETLNLLTKENKIITLRKEWNSDRTQYKLSFTSPNGKSETLGFIRKITSDDRNRIYAMNSAQAQSALAEAEAELSTLKDNYDRAKSENKEARASLNELWSKFDSDVKQSLLDEQRNWVIAKKKNCGEPNGTKEKPVPTPLVKQDFEKAIESFECDTEETLARIRELNGG